MVKNLKKKILKRIKKFNENVLPIYCYRSGVLSSLYYSFISSAFRREHQAVLAGRVKHLKEENNYYTLVRNTHRLEKGLLMIPRRSSFGKKYLKETIDNFANICKNNEEFVSNGQLKWFHDVIKEYFSVVVIDEEIKPLKEKFEAVVKQYSERIENTSKVPYRRVKENFSQISYDEFYKLTKQRRSVRWFQQREVPRKLIDKAILAANQSPSACNRQPFSYKIVDNPDFLKEIVNIPMGTAGYSHSIPVMIVVVGNLDAYFSERDRHLIYIDASLANMSLMLALETLGLSSCSINWPDIEDKERQMASLLNLRSYQRPIMCLGVGFPDMDRMVAFSEKRKLDDLRTYIKSN